MLVNLLDFCIIFIIMNNMNNGQIQLNRIQKVSMTDRGYELVENYIKTVQGLGKPVSFQVRRVSDGATTKRYWYRKNAINAYVDAYMFGKFREAK